MEHFVKVLCASIVLMFLLVRCGGSASDADTPTDETPRDSATQTDSDSTDSADTTTVPPIETDTPTTDGSDTSSQDNVPPELPDSCRLVAESIGGEPVGDFELSGSGDGRYPDVAYPENASSGLVLWSYFPKGSTTSRWGIQAATLTASTADGGDPEKPVVGETLTVIDQESSRLAEMASIAPGKSGYGVAYLDARWDTECSPTDYDACARDLAFLKLDNSGKLNDIEPLQLTTTGHIVNRPDIAATPDGGFVIAWIEAETNRVSVKLLKINPDGAAGDVYTLPEAADNYDGPALAVNEDTAVIVFATEGKRSIVAGKWPHDAASPDDSMEIVSDAHSSQRSPRIAAGTNGFLVGWNGQYGTSYEVFLRPLDETGEADGEIKRGTWSAESVSGCDVAWNGERFGLAWASPTANGASDCAVDATECKSQIFAAEVAPDGEIITGAVMLSNDPNRSQRSRIAWDGTGWTAVWQTWGNMRWRVFYGQMVCD